MRKHCRLLLLLAAFGLPFLVYAQSKAPPAPAMTSPHTMAAPAVQPRMAASPAAPARVMVRHGNRVFFVPYDPFLYDPFYGYPAYAYSYTQPVGKVKIEHAPKNAQVFVNHAFAGTVAESKTLTLTPGNYTIAVKEGSQELFDRRVYVMPGKTTHITAVG